MNSRREIIASKSIAPCINVVRGQRVIVDTDLASLYGVPTKRLNQQLARNRRKFPADFAFQLTAEEWEKLRLDNPPSKGIKNLKLQFATSSWSHGGRRKLPFVFTEHGTVPEGSPRELLVRPSFRNWIGLTAILTTELR